jgi:hypothetical protein
MAVTMMHDDDDDGDDDDERADMLTVMIVIMIEITLPKTTTTTIVTGCLLHHSPQAIEELVALNHSHFLPTHLTAALHHAIKAFDGEAHSMASYFANLAEPIPHHHQHHHHHNDHLHRKARGAEPLALPAHPPHRRAAPRHQGLRR